MFRRLSKLFVQLHELLIVDPRDRWCGGGKTALLKDLDFWLKIPINFYTLYCNKDELIVHSPRLLNLHPVFVVHDQSKLNFCE